MKLQGIISGINSSKTQIYILTLEEGPRRPFRASFEELSGPLLLKMSDGVEGISVTFEAPLQDPYDNRAINVDLNKRPSFCIDTAALDKIYDLIKELGANFQSPPQRVGPGKYEVQIIRKGRVAKATVSWKSRTGRVAAFLKSQL